MAQPNTGAATTARAAVPAIKVAASSPAAVTSPSAASAASVPAPSPSTHLKKFTFAQISDKVSKRRVSVPEYESLLLACRVRADADGAVFDSTHPAWSMLLHLCTVADTLAKEAAASRTKQHAAAIAAAAAAAEAAGTEPQPVPEPPELAPIVVHSRDFPLPPQRIDQLPPAHVQMSPPAGAAGASVATPKQTPAAAASNRKSPHVSPSTSAKKQKAAAAAAAAKGSSRAGAGAASSVSLSAVSTSTVVSPSAPGQPAGGADDEWISVRVKPSSSSPAQHKLLTQANVPPTPHSANVLSHAASSLFSQSTMSRAASALDKFSRAITARPVAQQPPHASAHSSSHQNRSTSSERRAAIMKASHADRPVASSSSSGGGKSSSNSSRDVSLVREDLEFEAMLAREYEAANKAKASTSAEGESKADGAAAAAAAATGAASKDSELLAQFVALIAPTVTTPDITAIKAICKVIGVPHKHRGQLWNVLLGVKQHDPASAAEGSSAAPSASRARLLSLPRELERPADHESDPETDAAMAAAHAAAAAAAAARTTSPSPTMGSHPTSPTPPDLDASAAFAAVVASGVAPTSPGPSVSPPPPPAGSSAASSAATPTASVAAASTAATIATASPPSHPKFDLHNQRVIRADIERTLPHLKTFQDPGVRHDMEVVLTTYCKEHSVSYKQGMNYVLAPLFLLNLPSREDILRIYERVITRLLNNTFVDNEFGSLQCTFLLFKLNLAYHDPELAVYLEQHDMGPELFASSWFITLFSNRCKLSVLFYLWDCLILDNHHDALLSFWVSLALLIQHRASILAESIVMLPESLSKLSITSKKEASILVNRCFSPGTPILLYNGTCKPVENVVLSDVLMGDDSKPRTIKSLHSGHTADDDDSGMFTITSTNGGKDVWSCNADHILVVRSSSEIQVALTSNKAARLNSTMWEVSNIYKVVDAKPKKRTAAAAAASSSSTAEEIEDPFAAANAPSSDEEDTATAAAAGAAEDDAAATEDTEESASTAAASSSSAAAAAAAAAASSSSAAFTPPGGAKKKVIKTSEYFATSAEARARAKVLMEDAAASFEISVRDYWACSKSYQKEFCMLQPPLVTFKPLRSTDTLASRLCVAYGVPDASFTRSQVLHVAWLVGMWLADGASTGVCITQIQEDIHRPDHSHTDVVNHVVKFIEEARKVANKQAGAGAGAGAAAASSGAAAAASSMSAMHDESSSSGPSLVSAQHKVPPKRKDGSAGNQVYNIWLGKELRNLLISYKLINNKHFPMELLTESKDVRKALLAGMIDGDGYYDAGNARLAVCAKERAFLDGLIHLCRGLGYRTGKVTATHCVNEETEEEYNGFRINISGNHLHEIKTVLKYKQPLTHEQRGVQPRYDQLGQRFTITPAGHGPYYGIELNGPNKRFLLGDFTVVHNSKKLYRGCSSLTARRQLRDYTSRKISMDSLDYHLLAAQVSLTVSEEELVKSCYDQIKLPGDAAAAAAEAAAAAAAGGSDGVGLPPSVTSLLSSSNPPLKFFILDCRPLEQYEAGHLPCAYHLDPDLLAHPSDLAERIESLASMKGCHFCFLGEGGEAPGATATAAAAAAAAQNGFEGRNHSGPAGTSSAAVAAAAAAAASSPASQSSAAVRALLLAFLKRGFKYLSRCEGGYAACHALILASDHALELVDHDQSSCLECTGRRVKGKEKKLGLLQSFRKQIGQLTQGKGERDAEKNAAAPDAISVEEFQSQNVPDSAVVLLMQPGTVASPGSASPSGLSSNLSLRLLHTVLRDKNVDVSSFADCMHRLTSILLGAFFDRVETKERNVSTGAGALFTGLESTPVTTIAPHPIAMELLDSAFHPYRPVCKRQSAVFEAEGTTAGAATAASSAAAAAESSAAAAASAASPASSSLVRRPSTAASASSSASPLSSAASALAAPSVSLTRVSVPSNLIESNILLFFPILSVDDLPLLLSILSELQSSHDAHASQITVLSILVARPVLWRLADAHPEVLLLSTGVDELTAQNRMVPGISKWEERYRVAQS